MGHTLVKGTTGLFSIHQIVVHGGLPIKQFLSILLRENDNAINNQIGRAVVWNYIHHGITKGSVVGGKGCLDLLRVFRLMCSKMTDQFFLLS